MSSDTNLRQAALKGGALLFGRQIVSVALKTIGVLMITRVLGPSSYGAYVSAFNIYQYAIALGSAGLGIYLLRQNGEVAERAYGTVNTLLLALAFILVSGLELGRHTITNWVVVEGVGPVMAIMILALPLQLLVVPASVRLERALNYRAVASIEMIGQISFYLTAVPLVGLFHWGPQALAIAYLLQQTISFVLSISFCKRLPHFAFDRTIISAMLRYSFDFSAANWIWQLRMLVNPVIVGPLLGAQAVGLIGMTIGLLENLSIIKSIVWRLSVAVLGRVQYDYEKLRKAVTEGMELQTLAVGTILLGFSWTGAYIVPVVFGERWAPVMDIYPYIAVSYLTISMFNVHTATLSVLDRNRDQLLCFFVHVVIFASVAYCAVPKLKMVGYGLGEICTLPTYLVLHFALAKRIGSPNYAVSSAWWAGTVVGLFWKELGLWSISVPFLVLLLPASRQRLKKYAQVVLRRNLDAVRV